VVAVFAFVLAAEGGGGDLGPGGAGDQVALDIAAGAIVAVIILWLVVAAVDRRRWRHSRDRMFGEE
jgi:uncharacterized membrane protein YccC